jgi:hypothetical protein
LKFSNKLKKLQVSGASGGAATWKCVKNYQKKNGTQMIDFLISYVHNCMNGENYVIDIGSLNGRLRKFQG